MVKGRGPALLVVVALLGGCGGRSALEARRQRLAAEQRGLDEALDDLEERMLTDQARVRLWQEMRARHESVAAIACTNLERHAEGIAGFEEKQREKRAAQQKKSRVAAAFAPGVGPVGTAR